MLGQLGALAEEDAAPLDQALARTLPDELAGLRDKFCAAMDDDFGTGDAVAQLFTLARFAKEHEDDDGQLALVLLRDLRRAIGLFLPGRRAKLVGPGGRDRRRRAVGADAADGIRDRHDLKERVLVGVPGVRRTEECGDGAACIAPDHGQSRRRARSVVVRVECRCEDRNGRGSVPDSFLEC